jgi:hypothetical protein
MTKNSASDLLFSSQRNNCFTLTAIFVITFPSFSKQIISINEICLLILLHEIKLIVFLNNVFEDLDFVLLSDEINFKSYKTSPRKHPQGEKIQCKKRLEIFPSPAGMSHTKLSLAGTN